MKTLSQKKDTMRRFIILFFLHTALINADPTPPRSHIPLKLQFIEKITRDPITKEMTVFDTTTIPHYTFFDSTYNQRVHLATHSHSEVVTDLAYYTLSGEWIEDIHRATPPLALHVSKTTFDSPGNTLYYSRDSESGTGVNTIKKSEERTTYYNSDGYIDSTDYLFQWSQAAESYSITQKSNYHYDKLKSGRLLKITAQRDDTLYEETYNYTDSSDLTKITIYKTFTFGDSLWHEKLHPIVHYCRDRDTTTIEYKSENGQINSHTIRKFNSDNTLREEINLNIHSGATHAKKTYTYTDDEYLKQKRLYKPNSDGELELIEEENYDYSWKPMAVIPKNIKPHPPTGQFTFHNNTLQLTLIQKRKGSISISNVSGRQLVSHSIISQTTSIPLTNLAQGAYIASLKIEGTVVNSFKFIR